MLPLLGLLSILLGQPRRAEAYTYQSPLGEGCHERLVIAALRAARAELPTAAPLPTEHDDRILVDDLPFHLPEDMRDIGAATLLVGVRDNDLRGQSGISSDELAHVHGEVDGQREHCLRRPEHDGAAGTVAAIADCREFILERFDEAVDLGLTAEGRIDLEARTALMVHLAFRGRARVELPLFYLRMGQALHAFQDAFSHTFRTADQRRITAALNWIDFIGTDYERDRDGPPHIRALDLCTSLDELRQTRLALAQEATAALVGAALDPDLDRSAKKLAAREVVTQAMTVEPGCDATNRWCEAPELAYEEGCSCAFVGTPAHATWGGFLVFLAIGLALWRRATFAALALCMWLYPSVAKAHDPKPWGEGERTGIAFHASGAAALDNGAFAYVAAGRYGVTERWLVGLDAEYNPWFSLEAGRISRGAFNGYLTLIHRYPVSRHFALRTTAHLGVSVLLFDLVGAPMGSVGPHLGVSLLGLSYEIDDHVYLVLDPADVAWPVPQIIGAPFSYRQYRLTLGIQIGA